MKQSKAGELRDRGFTLIELLVVCSILAATAYLAWGSFLGVQENADDTIALAEMQRLADGLQRFRADTGYYPGQGPFALAAPGTVLTPSGSGYSCAPAGGVLRTWATPALDADRDAWFSSPANLALLFEAPALCTNHPLAYLNHWSADTRRGWHGPYLSLASRRWVDHGADFNADASGTLTATPYGDGSPVAGTKVRDVPAFGAGPRLRAAGPTWGACDTPETPAGTCMLGWRSVPRSATGYDAAIHALPAHARPFALFGLVDGDAPRVVYFGADGRYGGRNPTNPCQPNTATHDGEDDVVLCLGH